MMDKRITLVELAEFLRQRSHISEEDSVKFVNTFVEVLEQNLLKDNMVKIKGLGTFKLMNVDGRESVDVNTGKRILIGAHAKVTFTPEAVLRDAVNKPFADFSTVTLNEETPEQIMEAEDIEETETVEDVETTVNNETEVTVEPQEEIVPETAPEIAIPDAVVTPEEVTIPAKPAKKCWWIFACVACFIIGFVFADIARFDACRQLKNIVTSWKVDKSEKVNVINEVVEVFDTTLVVADTVTVAPVDSSAFFPQVEDGEYLIVGVQAKEKMRIGKNLTKFSRQYFDSKDFVKYIIVMNHIENPDLIPLNAEILIPKLELKNK